MTETKYEPTILPERLKVSSPKIEDELIENSFARFDPDPDAGRKESSREDG